MKILIIDDEPNVCRYIANEFYDSLNVESIIIDNYTCLEHILDDRFSAVILDVMMPVLPGFFSEEEMNEIQGGYHTGFILFNRIRKKYPKLPIIYYTSYSSQIYCDECSIIIKKPELGKVVVKSVCLFIDICTLKSENT